MFGGARIAAAASVVLLAACAPSHDAEVVRNGALIKRYCFDCHDDVDRTADLSLQAMLPLDKLPQHRDVWEKVVRKLRAGMMPPVDGHGPELEPADRAALAGWLETELDRVAAASPDPGRTEPLHRLNRTEYRNAIRDLLALDVDVSELLPADDSSYGFDDIAGVLKLSPTLLERYLNAADKLSRLAVGRPSPFTTVDYFHVPDDRSQESRLPGLPFGTRGGTRIHYAFPADAEYEIKPELARDLNEQLPLYAEPQQLEVSIDGQRVALFTLPGVPPASAAARPKAAPPVGDAAPADAAPEAAAAPPAAKPAASKPKADPPISQIAARLTLPFAERAKRNRADENWRARVPVAAGEHDVVVTFLARTHALDETARLPFARPYPAGVNIPETRTGAYLRSVEISGPYEASGAGQTASRERIFSCSPGGTRAPAAAGAVDAATGCAREILRTLARRAYRRPVTNADVEPLLAFYRAGCATGDFDAGIQLALKRLLVSPEFLFRVERDPADAAPGRAYRVSDVELASRLSFFLWSSIPDDALLDAAERGQLRVRGELERQVARMLADPRSDAFVSSFAGQWLYLRNLTAAVPVQNVFPDFDDTLREGLRRETELFFASVVRENLSAYDLLRADYTFLNERVARHYGIPNVKGPEFRRVQLPADNPRRGLLGQGSILTVTSYPNRTSPVVRGKWILENLLGAPPPAPPPNVPKLAATDGTGETLSMRARMAAHRANPVCASCHKLMDPLGFSLENFDGVGVWRTLGESGAPIDASGALPDGTPFTGAAGLRDALLKSDRFVATLTEKLMTYALGRGVEYYDMPAVRKIVRDAAPRDYKLTDLIVGVIESEPFQMRRAREDTMRTAQR